MDFLQSLENERENVDPWNSFLVQYRKESNILYVFHEGKDDTSFYRTHIKSHLKDGWSFIFFNAKNKKGVLKYSDEFLENYSEDSKVIFLVDKDHDDFIDNKQQKVDYKWIYTTSYYSIENYVCSEDVLICFFNDMGLDMSGKEIKSILENYRKMFDSFSKEVSIVMAFIICAKIKRIELKLSNLELNNYLKLNNENVTKKITGSDIFSSLKEQIVKNQADVNNIIEDEVIELEKELQKIEVKKWLRGKEDMWFFIEFIKKIKDHHQIKFNVNLSEGNAMQQLGPRSTSPICFNEFMIRVFQDKKVSESKMQSSP